MKAPTGRNASVNAIENATAVSGSWNSLPIAVRQNATRKKSNASRVQPRKLAVSAFHWSDAAAADSSPLLWRAAGCCIRLPQSLLRPKHMIHPAAPDEQRISEAIEILQRLFGYALFFGEPHQQPLRPPAYRSADVQFR